MENIPLVDFTLISTNGNNEVWESENFIFLFSKNVPWVSASEPRKSF